MAGATYEEIAVQLGYKSKSGPWMAVNEAIKEVEKETLAESKDLIALQFLRYEALLAALWHRAINGDLKAVDKSDDMTCVVVRVE